MDTAPLLRVFPAPQPEPPPAPPPVPPKTPEVIAAWPRCAQMAGVYLLGALTTLLAVNALSYLRSGAEPTAIETARPLTYRVDLNEARRTELLQLPGVGPALADRIEEYRRDAGDFRSVEDLLKVKGIGPATLERVRPFVSVKTPVTPALVEVAAKPTKSPSNTSTKLASLNEPIDVNNATLTDLQKLPGIGPKLSQRIVDERERKPFASVNDLRRVAGIGPKTLEKIKPYVAVK